MKITDLQPEEHFRDKRLVELGYHYNFDGRRTLAESVMSPHVLKALKDWAAAGVQHCVLIGGLALSYHGKARYTEDGDFLFMGAGDFPDEVRGFKRTRPHCFRHKDTHVEIEVLDPEFLKMDLIQAQKIFDTAIESGGIKVASREGLIVSKLGRFNRRDQGDIEHLVELSGSVDFSDWSLTDDQKKKLAEFDL
jgi:hypothetical protein